MKHPSHRRTIGLLAALLSLAGMATAGSAPTAEAVAAVPDPDRTSQDETAWGWHRNVTAATVKDFLAKGYRIVDLEVRSSTPRFDVAYVKNAGTYQRGWWWYYGQTGARSKPSCTDKKARLIDIEPYSTARAPGTPWSW